MLFIANQFISLHLQRKLNQSKAQISTSNSTSTLLSSVKSGSGESEYMNQMSVDSDTDADEAIKVLTDQSNVQGSSKHRKQASMTEADAIALIELGNENTHSSGKANTLGPIVQRNSVTRASVKKSATTASASIASAKAMRMQTVSLNDLPTTSLSTLNQTSGESNEASYEHDNLIMPYRADVPQTSDDLLPIDKVRLKIVDLNNIKLSLI